jgi:UDP-MurNAc hydroxylase
MATGYPPTVRVTSLGHAGLKIETARATLLVDPWFSPEGAFQASWFQYPENGHLLTEDLFRPTAVIISHEHLDHVDPWFLGHLPSDVPVVIPRYPSPVLRNKVETAGRRILAEAEPWEVVPLADGTNVFFVSEESPMNHDSAIVTRGDGQTLLDLNDARLSPVQFRQIRAEVGGTVDLFSFQAAGASWYPMCYELPERRRRELSERKRAAKLSYAVQAMRVVEPLMGLPFAGPPCFLDRELFQHNDEMERGIFPDQHQAAEHLASRGITDVTVLLPGDAWDVDAWTKSPDPLWNGFSIADRWPYLRRYQARRLPHIEAVRARYPEPSDSLWEPFREYFVGLLRMNPYFNSRIGLRVGFDITGPGGGRWAVDFRPGHEGVEGEMGECSYRYRFASRWLPPILAGRVPWEDFFLSLRFSAWREPDLYNDHLLGLLKFAERKSLAAVETYETSLGSDEWLTIHAEDRSFRVERYCPHAGNDLLETGEVLTGRILRCLAHHYEFDLETGRCVNGMVSDLDVEPLPD